jgi:N-methylhydantoinase B
VSFFWLAREQWAILMRCDKPMIRDPILFEVIKNVLISVTEEMSAALQRAAYSTNIKTRRDFSCAVFDSKLQVIAQASAQPSHLGSLPHSVPRAVRDYGPEKLRPGDGLLINDPYHDAVHLNDIALITPAYDNTGALIGYVANVAHHVDIGGSAPGSLAPAREIYQEGLTIPPVRIIEQGEINRDIWNLILANVRSSDESAGDFRAQIAANNLGVHRLVEIANRAGRETFVELCEALISYTERRARVSLAELPRGEYSGEDFLDDDGFSHGPIRIRVTVRIDNEGVTVDLSGTDRQVPGSTNCSYSMTFSGVAYVMKTLVDKDIPVNAGFYRCFRLMVPQGTVTRARAPAAVGGGWEVVFRVVEAMYRALAEAVPQRVVAGTKGTICNVAFGGIDPSGHRYAYYETIAGGGGARPTKDGMDGIQTHIHNTENAPVEEIEISYPFRILRYSLIPDSEGPGKYRGGLGVRRDYWFPDHSVTFSILSDRARFAPWGIFGGGPGRPARFIRNPGGNETVLPSKVSVELEPGEVVSIQTPGGGGYGDPSERSREAVRRDTMLGKVSLERAREVYQYSENES